MNWRKRTVSDVLNVRGTYILDTFNEYLENVYWVDRKYQRKLVWTLKEKQDFIDTILHNYPVPIFLVAKYKLEGEEKYRKDIIDGLQRLNAIFSFIQNEFPVKTPDGNYRYFNLSALAGANEMIARGILRQEPDMMDCDTSRKFLNYQLPITTTEVSDSEIEDIFVRINATGRKLSKQDLRQAGAIGAFSDLVRQTACYVRGDISESDTVPLSEMPSLSLSNKNLKYDIDVRNAFWIKHGILTENNLRISRDEEIIARIYSYMILGNSISPSSNALNRMYTIGTEYNEKLNNYVEQNGLLNVMDKFSKVYADILHIFDSVDAVFSSWIFENRDISGKSKVFQALFLALFELKEEMFVVEDYTRVADAIEYIGNREFREITNDNDWNARVRNDTIRRVRSILQPEMVKVIPDTRGVNDEWKLKLEMMLLSAAGVESQMYDFKMGLTTLSTGIRNDECISKIVKTLTAMANTNPDKEATIVIGIANDEEDARQFSQYYSTNCVRVANCYVTGIDDEIKKFWKNRDAYFTYIKDKIAMEGTRASEEVVGLILRNFYPIVYQERTLVILTLRNPGKPLAYDKILYERHGSHNVKIDTGTPEFYNLIARTTKASSQSNVINTVWNPLSVLKEHFGDTAKDEAQKLISCVTPAVAKLNDLQTDEDKLAYMMRQEGYL